MVLSSIELHQFRSHATRAFTFDPHLTLITGKNGAGKTNLLEAVYTLLQGSSFRGVSDGELTQFDATWWRVSGLVGDTVREVRYQSDRRPMKQLRVHDTHKRFTHKDRLPVVLFDPEDLLFVHGSPSRRRASVDTMLCALSYEYKLALSKYERALRQRNNALKQYGALASLQDRLFVWDVALSEYGEQLIAQRSEFVQQLNERIPRHYGQIAGKPADVELRYERSLSSPGSSSQFIEALSAHLTTDARRATTSVGPHRDDFTFHLGGSPVKTSASRGEVRSLILSLKLAYAELLHEAYNTLPLLLLDDVFSELDETRQTNILASLKHYQTILTDTKRSTKAHQIRLSV